MKIGQKVYIGACVGTIVDIIDGKVEVAGRFYYAPTDEYEDIISEPWNEEYTLEQFANFPWNEKHGWWDASKEFD